MFLALVPAYNEEKKIGSVVRSLFGHVDEIVVIDDGSKDATAKVAREAGATVLRHEINRGQGAALETGHAYARQRGASYVVHFDGDGQFDVADIAAAKQHLIQAHADILFGSRFLHQQSDIPWTKRALLLPLARLVQKYVFGVSLSDAHNGFRILNKEALEKIVITQDRMAHATEIPVLAKHHGLVIIEFPVKIHYHQYGQGPKGALRILKDLFIGQFVDK